MVRQYIGARYVPKFFENHNNTSEWLPNVIYEPLTIVTYGNNSYTSKKTVPASVGDPSNNPDYWVATGNFNAFINEIQNEIDEINNTTIPDIQSDINTINNTTIPDIQGDIDTINNTTIPAIQGDINTINTVLDGNVIMLTDSFGGYYNNSKNFMELTRDYLGLTTDNCECLWHDGYGFYAGSFLMLLQTSTLDPISVKDIIVIGGNNDKDRNSTDLTNAMTAFIAYVKTNYPNAKLTIVYDVFNPLLHGDTYFTTYEIYRNMAIGAGCKFYNINSALHLTSYLNSDGVHPTPTGVVRLARALVQAITTGNECLNDYYNTVTFDSSANASISGQLLQGIFDGQIVTMCNDSFHIDFTNAVSVNSGLNINAGVLSRARSMQQLSVLTWIPVETNLGHMALGFTEGKLYIANLTGTNQSNISRITVYKFSYSQPLLGV